MMDPGLQRIPTGAAREILEHRQAELEAEAEQQREARLARAARKHHVIRAAFRRLGLSRHGH